MYDPAIASTLMRACILANSRKVPKGVKLIDGGTTQAILLRHGNYNILAFRATEDIRTEQGIKDWIVNLSARKNFRGMHEGFWGGYKQVSRLIATALSAEKHRPLIITGFSQGGGIAPLAAWTLQDTHNVHSCYTFAAPRCGSGKFVKQIKVPVYRVAHRSDIVTKVPGRWWFSFRHVGKVHRIGDRHFFPRVSVHDEMLYLQLLVRENGGMALGY
jgi:predicted lipase